MKIKDEIQQDLNEIIDANIISMIEDKELRQQIGNSLIKNEKVSIASIIFSTNKNIFGSIVGNREINKSHVNELKEKISKEGFNIGQPIVIDPDFNVIDGQHRLQACIDLWTEGKDINLYYIIQDNIENSIDMIIDMQKNHKNWTPKDYIKSYADLGNSSYVKLNALFNDPKYKHFSFTVFSRVFTGSRNAYIRSQIVNGEFVYTDERANNALKVLDNINEILSVIDEEYEKSKKVKAESNMISLNRIRNKLKRELFVCPIMLLMRNENYNNKKMAKIIIKNASIVESFSNVNEVGRELVKLYNYRLKNAKDKLPDYDDIKER